MRASILIHMRKAFHPFHYLIVKKPSLHWDQKLSQNQRGVLSREARRSKKERMHKLAQKAGAKKRKVGPCVKRRVGRGEVVGTWNTKWDKWPVFMKGMCFIFHIECFWEKDLKEKGAWFYLPGSSCSNQEFDPFGCSTWWADTQWVHLSFLNCPPL